jgi:hypothetical protein
MQGLKKGKIMTQENKHTPGPWLLTPRQKPNGYDLSGRNSQHFITDITHYKHDGICNHIIDEMNEEQEANAHLIAAAPELLEALELMVIKFGTDEIGNDLNHYAVKQANKAIKKARG